MKYVSRLSCKLGEKGFCSLHFLLENLYWNVRAEKYSVRCGGTGPRVFITYLSYTRQVEWNKVTGTVEKQYWIKNNETNKLKPANSWTYFIAGFVPQFSKYLLPNTQQPTE